MTSGKTCKYKLGEARERPYAIVLLSVVIRALHQVGAAVYLSSFLIGGIGPAPALYLWLAVVTGLLLTASEGLRHVQLYREVAGISTALKLILLGFAYHGALPAAATVTAAFIVAAVGAHLPKHIRHRLLY